MKRVVLLLVALLSFTMLYAQDSLRTDTVEKHHEIGIIRETIRGFDRTEDDYIEPQHYEFTVMMQVTRTFENFDLSSNNQNIRLAPDGLTKIGPYFGWRWFFFGYTFDIKNLSFGSGGLRKEFDLSIYSSQIGVDVFYRRSGSDYKIRDVKLGGLDGDLFEDMPFSGMKLGITGVSAYYIFNHGHFSYPAAFSQSTCQKVSCGSWLAGAGYTRNTIDLDHEALRDALNSRLPEGQTVELDSGMMFNSIKYNDFMFSGGYAYNWVFAKNWLFGSSLQMALGYKRSYGDMIGGERGGFTFKNFNIDGVGRFGLVYNNMRWYAGASAILHTYNYSKSRFRTNNTFGSLNVYVGCNFGLKKKYRKKS